jgi:hypothetical protein
MSENYVIYHLNEDGSMQGQTEEEAIAEGIPRELWDKTDETYLATKSTVDAAMQHFQEVELPAAKMNLTEDNRNIFQCGHVYMAVIIALTDFVKRSSGEIQVIPNDYDGEDFVAEMKGLAKAGLTLQSDDWPCDETHDWWNTVQSHVPSLWI